MSGHEHRIESMSAAMAFILAGNATFTARNPNTGNRFTFRVQLQKGAATPVHHVSVLTGADNVSDYSYLGTIFDGQTYRHGRKSRVGLDAPSAKAFAWIWNRMVRGLDIGPAEIWHQGRCGACNRPLTVPEHIAIGLGPICAGRAA